MIDIRDLTKTYDGFSLDVSMHIRPGMVSGIVGRNGSGKTTLIKSVLGLIKPDGGSVLTMGKDPAEFTPEDKLLIGTAMPDSGFSGYLSLRNILKILKALYPDFDEAFFTGEADRASLPPDKRISEFSTGMKAKLKVLIACCHKAKLLILDEPTAGLDVIARRDVLDMLRSYLKEDRERTLLISSHISGDLESICDDIYMIDNGRIVLHEDTDRIQGEYALLKLGMSQYETIDKTHILRVRKESYGYDCLTDRRQFYMDNYPEYVMEDGSIDQVIIMMTEGKKL